MREMFGDKVTFIPWLMQSLRARLFLLSTHGLILLPRHAMPPSDFDRDEQIVAMHTTSCLFLFPYFSDFLAAEIMAGVSHGK